jgi:hypothetical protein
MIDSDMRTSREDAQPHALLRVRAQWGELYAMNLTLTEDEARRYGREATTVMVTAVFLWSDAQQLENFRQFISITQGDPNSPFRRLIQDMWARKVTVLELAAEQLRDRLRRHRRAGFVAVNPGPEQTLQKIDDFLAELA